MNVQIQTVHPSTPLLAQVIKLGDANSRFLGTYPFSAYERDARKGRIIAAVGDQDQLMGYLLYRVARGRAVIQHCCVSESHRGSGVGKLLVAELKSRTERLFAIELHCAREFDAAKFWEANGFVAFGGKEGRGADRRPLTRFVFDHRNADLFTSQLDSNVGDRLLVVVDTNVVYDWQDQSRPTAAESLALRADWLTSEIDLRITDYAFADADACNDTPLRDRRKRFLAGIPKVNEDRAVAQEVLQQLAATLSLSSRPSTAMDLRHLAAASAAGADVFVTQDKELVDAGAQIEEELGLAVCTPAMLIARLDEDLQAGKYRPVRLSGSATIVRSVGSADIEPLARQFHDHSSGERLRSFETTLRGLVANPKMCSLRVIEWPAGNPVGLLGIDGHSATRVVVPVMRFRESEVTNVLLRHVAVLLVRTAASQERAVVDITEPQADLAENALRGIGFTRAGDLWRRFVPTGLHTRDSLVAWFSPTDLPLQKDEVLTESVAAWGDLCRTAPAQVVEQSLWPVKLAKEPLQTFIVPIRPRWAEHLFDEGLANQTLRGGDPTLMFNTENVYYKSARQQTISAPARVLWYVSDDGDSDGVGSIRACSPVLEVEVGSAKALFAKFRRLGVYEWRNLMESTGEDPQGRLMALRFGVTDCFKQSVPRESIREVLKRFAKPMPPLTTAYALPDGAFEEIYALGSNSRHS